MTTQPTSDNTTGEVELDPNVIKEFLETVRQTKEAFTFSDGANGLPTRQRNEEGTVTSIPFFSTREKAEAVVGDFEGFSVVPVTLDVLLNSLLPEVTKMTLYIGTDWNPGGAGFDLPAPDVANLLASDEEITVTKNAPAQNGHDVPHIHDENGNAVPVDVLPNHDGPHDHDELGNPIAKRSTTTSVGIDPSALPSLQELSPPSTSSKPDYTRAPWL